MVVRCKSCGETLLYIFPIAPETEFSSPIFEFKCQVCRHEWVTEISSVSMINNSTGESVFEIFLSNEGPEEVEREFAEFRKAMKEAAV